MSTEATTEALLADVLADEPMLSGAVFIDAESPAYRRAIIDAMVEKRIFVVVFPAGGQMICAPAVGLRERLLAMAKWPFTVRGLIGAIEDVQRAPAPRAAKTAPRRLRHARYALSRRVVA
jgi:hypothetical protein